MSFTLTFRVLCFIFHAKKLFNRNLFGRVFTAANKDNVDVSTNAHDIAVKGFASILILY